MKHNQTLSMILMLSTAAGMALAAPEKKQSERKDLLRGPAVVESGTNTNKEPNDSMMNDAQQKELDNRPIVMRELAATLRVLSSEQSGNQLNLTPEQSAQIKTITEKFRTDMQAYQQENRDKIRQLRDQVNKEATEHRQTMRQQRQADTEKGDDNTEQKNRAMPIQSEAAKKLRNMIENSPASQNAIASIRKVLSAEQMQLVEQTAKKTRQRTPGEHQGRPDRKGPDGVERETPRRQIDPDRVRTEERRQRNQKSKTDKPIDD